MSQIKRIPTRFQREAPYYKPRRYYKIFILAKNDYYFIVEKRKLYKSGFFKNIFDLDKTSGNITNPLFLRKHNSPILKHIIEYLNFYYNKIDYFEVPTKITFNDMNFYLNNFDRNYLEKFDELSISELKCFLKNIAYFNIPSLTAKLEFFLFFKKNQSRIK
jgi:hypothetical protein